jgi:hypothetical protein
MSKPVSLSVTLCEDELFEVVLGDEDKVIIRFAGVETFAQVQEALNESLETWQSILIREHGWRI